MVQFDVKRVQKGNESFMVSFDFNKTPITQIADYIIIAASKYGTSDIHFDPREEGMMVRFRIDGDCQDYTFIPKAYERNLTTRIKIMANMNITEMRLPQDGAIKGNFGDTYLDMRVSSLPLNLGEKIVIRILDLSRSLQGVDTLGFHPDNLEKIKRMMNLPSGIILTTGATGSGKSTTTYSILQELNKPEVNVITVEDPIEMNLDGINQVQVNSEIGMTFAAALRSILRQDPNIVLIGEIRDSETAQIAVRTSITGHLVLSTIHTNNALSTIERLLDMDVERYLLSTAMAGIISQRLAKMLCSDCRYQRETTKYEKKIFKKFLKKDIDKVWDANPKGCEHCRKGYKGRIAFHEVLEIDESVRSALSNEKLSKKELAQMVYVGKTITMLQDALIKCLDGKTSFEEVYRNIEIENEDDDNYEAEMEEIESSAPVGDDEEAETSDDLLETPVTKSEVSSISTPTVDIDLTSAGSNSSSIGAVSSAPVVDADALISSVTANSESAESSVIPTLSAANDGATSTVNPVDEIGTIGPVEIPSLGDSSQQSQTPVDVATPQQGSIIPSLGDSSSSEQATVYVSDNGIVPVVPNGQIPSDLANVGNALQASPTTSGQLQLPGATIPAANQVPNQAIPPLIAGANSNVQVPSVQQIPGGVQTLGNGMIPNLVDNPTNVGAQQIPQQFPQQMAQLGNQQIPQQTVQQMPQQMSSAIPSIVSGAGQVQSLAQMQPLQAQVATQSAPQSIIPTIV